MSEEKEKAMKALGWPWAPRLAVLAVLGWGAALVLADDEGATIKTPQKARLQFTNGRIISGTLLAVTDKEVEFQQARDSAPAVKYKLAVIKAIQTADDVYICNAKEGRFESQKARSGGESASEPKKGPAGGLQFVVAEGTGSKPEAAVAAAERAAVLRVVATLVDGRTFSQEEKTIADKVLSGLSQVVKGRRLLAQGKDGGGRVRLLVAVDRRAVATRLEGAGLKVKAGPRGLGTAVPTEEDIRARGAEVINEVLADLPLTLVTEARATGVEEEVNLSVEARLRTDLEAYGHLVRRLRKVLDVLKIDQHAVPLTTQQAGPEEGRRRSGPIFRGKEFTAKADAWVLWLATETDPAAKKMHWERFLVGTDFKQSTSSITGRQYLLLTALGPGGAVAGADLQPLEPDRVGYLDKEFHKWGWADASFGNPAWNQLFVTPVGLNPVRARAAELDCIPERRKLYSINISGTNPRLITGVACTLLLLPQ
jgi:hypothetical protein